MEDKKENKIKEVFNNLNEENQDIMILLAKGMEISQNSKENNIKIV